MQKILSEIEILLLNLDFTGRRVLDIGCGTGKLARALAGKCREITGIDVPEVIEQAVVEPYPGNVSFKNGTAQSLPCEDESADIIIYFASFHHVPEKEMGIALKECTRVLKRGGIVCFVEPLTRSGSYFELARLLEDEHDIQMTAYEMIKSLLKQGYSMEPEDFYYIERSLADFEKYVNIYVADEKVKTGILDKAVNVVYAKNAGPEEKVFQSHIRVNILTKK
jgi:ubiquinone/menaquinone biosynthesis C-methylase UbiE